MKHFSSFLKKKADAAQQSVQQKGENVKQAPAGASSQEPTLTIALENQTRCDTVFAYISGRAIDKNNEWILLRSDGVTPYYPSSPKDIMQPFGADCAIRLAPPGQTVQVQIPHIAGGRIWFSIEKPITFYLNPGPALVEPSVSNPSDPNAQLDWGFAEFTWNHDQLYANISYVDFVSLPIALTLQTRNSGMQHVSGMEPDGLQRVANGLREQAKRDGQGWDQLIVNRAGSDQPLRVLNPNQGMVMNPNLFQGYFDDYVNEVWTRFEKEGIEIDTQAAPGNVTAKVKHGKLDCGNGSVFSKPNTHDIFSCNTGPFVTGSNAQTNALIPRIAAAFNRSEAHASKQFPAAPELYYQHPITNHYSRVVHEVNLDGKGYAYAYDDVQPSDGKDQSGEVHAGDPTLFTVTVGGHNCHCT